MQATLEDLRRHLFQAIENINNPEEGTDIAMEIQKSKAIANVSKQIIDSAKTELAAIRILQKDGYELKPSHFFNQKQLS